MSTRGRLPATVPLGLRWAVLEIKALSRSRDAMWFLVALPVLLLVLLAAVFGEQLNANGISAGQYYTPVIIASSVLAVGMMNLGVSLAIERTDGTLRRLALTPMTISSFIIGKLLMTLVVAVAMTALLVVVGVSFYRLDLPTDASRWFTFGWVFTLGLTSASLLGISLSTLARDGKSAPVVLNPPFLVLQFVSGVFVEFSQLPSWMQQVSSVFPLRWLASGMRAVFMPGAYERAVEPGGSYQLGRGAVVLTAWVIASFVLAVKTFRWGGESR